MVSGPHSEVVFTDLSPRPPSPASGVADSTRLDLASFLAQYDRNADGHIDLEELSYFLVENGLPISELHELINRLDHDQDGSISAHDDFNADGALSEHDLEIASQDSRRLESYALCAQIAPQLREALTRSNALLRARLDAIQVEQNDVNGRIALYEHSLPVLGLRPQLQGITILHLSDLHFSKDRPARPSDLLQLHRALRKPPNFVVITGDFIDEQHQDLNQEAMLALERITAGAVTFFVLGNHDARAGSKQIVRSKLVAAGFHDLTNRNCRLMVEDVPLNFLGIDDALTGTPIVPSIPPRQLAEARIVLTHNLDALNNAFPRGIDLVLSGHLHSGEINLGLFDGVDWLIRHGVYQNLNDQRRGWKPLSHRTLSLISPGLHTHNLRRFGVEKAGAALLYLKPFSAQN